MRRNALDEVRYGLQMSSKQSFIFPGVKNADENELHSIASEPDESHVYNVADFSIMSSIVEGLTRTVCEQVVQQDKDIKESKETTKTRCHTRFNATERKPLRQFKTLVAEVVNDNYFWPFSHVLPLSDDEQHYMLSARLLL